MERSLVILKPDAIQRGLMGTLLGRLEARGFRFIGMKLMQIDDELARTHYGEHADKPFFPGLVDYIKSGPVVVVALEGENVIQLIRNMVGKTRPSEAAPGTIRGDFAISVGRNLIHASDSPENGVKEVGNFFRDDELLTDFNRVTDPWIFES